MGDVGSTTLFTFRIDVPSHVRSVELLGSWDNFSHSYRMERDQKRGSNHWYGIFTFKDIICDGVDQSSSNKREGGLKMGGTYWYHYMLDGVYEFHDETKPFTTTCPLLLGECVNILEVPFEEVSQDFDLSFPRLPVLSPPFTMDPQARFSTPRPNKFEALSRKPIHPPPSPFFPSPVTPSCEDSSRSPFAASTDLSFRLSASVGSDVRPRTSYSRHGLLDRASSSANNARPSTAGNPSVVQRSRHQNLRSTARPISAARSEIVAGKEMRPVGSRNDSGVAGHGYNGRTEKSGSDDNTHMQVESLLDPGEEKGGQGQEEVRAFNSDEDTLSDSGATLGCWMHRGCLLRKRNDLAETKARQLYERDILSIVDAWIEETTIAQLDGEFPWDSDNALSFGQSPTRPEFSDILDANMTLDADSYWPPRKLSNYDEDFASEDGPALLQLKALERVDEEPTTYTDFDVVDPDAMEDDLQLTRMPTETDQFIESFELPPVLTLDTSFPGFDRPQDSPKQFSLMSRSPPQSPQEDYSRTDHFMETFVLPLLNTKVGEVHSSFEHEPTQSLRSAASIATFDIPQLEHSVVLSPTCSSPDTASSMWAESFHFWSEQDGEDDLEDIQLDYSSSATSPGLLPTVTHSRSNSWFNGGGWYSLPEDQYSSQATLTKVTTQTTIVRSESPPLRAKRHSVARAGNSELEGMDELMNDFGYLGEAVI